VVARALEYVREMTDKFVRSRRHNQAGGEEEAENLELRGATARYGERIIKDS
jgi:hypothetical protein